MLTFLGQEKETYVARLVVKNSVDEKLRDMQLDKQAAIDAALGDGGARPGRLNIQELIRLFGTVGDNEFIWPDADTELDP